MGVNLSLAPKLPPLKTQSAAMFSHVLERTASLPRGPWHPASPGSELILQQIVSPVNANWCFPDMLAPFIKLNPKRMKSQSSLHSEEGMSTFGLGSGIDLAKDSLPVLFGEEGVGFALGICFLDPTQ